jgi:hypothetical protein
MTMSSKEVRDRFEIDGLQTDIKARLQTAVDNDECGQRPKAAERHLASSGNPFHLDFPHQAGAADAAMSKRPDLESHWLAVDAGGAELMNATSGSLLSWSPIALPAQEPAPRLLAAPAAVEPSLYLKRRALVLTCVVVLLLVLLVTPP